MDSAGLVDLIHGWQEEPVMSDLFWLKDKQMRRIEPQFPLSPGIPRMDDRRVLSGIIFEIRNGLCRRDTLGD